MLRPVSQAFTAATTPGPQAPLTLDTLPAGYTTCALWASGDGVITAAVEGTLDDVNDPLVTPRWFPIAGGSLTGTGYVRFYEPWRWVRLNITTITGNVEFKVAQSVTSDRTF